MLINEAHKGIRDQAIWKNFISLLYNLFILGGEDVYSFFDKTDLAVRGA